MIRAVAKNTLQCHASDVEETDHRITSEILLNQSKGSKILHSAFGVSLSHSRNTKDNVCDIVCNQNPPSMTDTHKKTERTARQQQMLERLQG